MNFRKRLETKGKIVEEKLIWNVFLFLGKKLKQELVIKIA